MNQLIVKRYDQVFQDCYRELINYVNSYINNSHNAEDIVHDAYLKGMKANELRAIKNVRAFLFRVVSNLMKDQARYDSRRSNKVEALQINECLMKEIRSPYQYSLNRERKALLKKAVAELPIKCRRVFILYKFSQMSHKQISVKLGISVSTIEKHVIKAMGHCRSYMHSRA
ncbi:MAG: sigma-70 family RNA polymerase sigma factor [Lentisphaeraceae bacterium]|nr:sigma-70 family RNA polymerase sigma factor [Lentisphaeraceae bacterium]